MKSSPQVAAMVFATLMSVSAWAQDAKPEAPKAAEPPAAPVPADLPSAESLFEKHIAAVGGSEAIKTEKNRLVRGKIQTGAQGIEGALRTIRVAPNKFYQTIELPGIVTLETWYNGEEAWVRDSNRDTRRVSGPELSELKLQADYAGEMNYKGRYKEIKTVGREQFEEADVFVVKATPNAGRDRTLYFDAKSGLLIGIRMATEKADVDSVTVLSDYKKFGDLLHPTKSVQKLGGNQTTVTVTQIETNLTMLPTVEPPDEVRAIK